jgi:Mn-dependent DtxR family transcriptional regulator
LSERDKIIFAEFLKFHGKSQYLAIKHISKKKNLAPSTLKYFFKKLRKESLVNYNGKIEITVSGKKFLDTGRKNEPS